MRIFLLPLFALIACAPESEGYWIGECGEGDFTADIRGGGGSSLSATVWVEDITIYMYGSEDAGHVDLSGSVTVDGYFHVVGFDGVVDDDVLRGTFADEVEGEEYTDSCTFYR